jgi:hypothetical protein
MAFTCVVLRLGMVSLLIARASLIYLSWRNMQMRAAQPMDEIATLSGASSDVRALDYDMSTSKSTKLKAEC